MSMVIAPNGLSAYVFGGVFDVEDDDENLNSIFFNDCFKLDLEKFVWRSVNLSRKKTKDINSENRKTTDEKNNGKS